MSETPKLLDSNSSLTKLQSTNSHSRVDPIGLDLNLGLHSTIAPSSSVNHDNAGLINERATIFGVADDSASIDKNNIHTTTNAPILLDSTNILPNNSNLSPEKALLNDESSHPNLKSNSAALNNIASSQHIGRSISAIDLSNANLNSSNMNVQNDDHQSNNMRGITYTKPNNSSVPVPLSNLVGSSGMSPKQVESLPNMLNLSSVRQPSAMAISLSAVSSNNNVYDSGGHSIRPNTENLSASISENLTDFTDTTAHLHNTQNTADNKSAKENSVSNKNEPTGLYKDYPSINSTNSMSSNSPINITPGERTAITVKMFQRMDELSVRMIAMEEMFQKLCGMLEGQTSIIEHLRSSSEINFKKTNDNVTSLKEQFEFIKTQGADNQNVLFTELLNSITNVSNSYIKKVKSKNNDASKYTVLPNSKGFTNLATTNNQNMHPGREPNSGNINNIRMDHDHTSGTPFQLNPNGIKRRKKSGYQSLSSIPHNYVGTHNKEFASDVNSDKNFHENKMRERLTNAMGGSPHASNQIYNSTNLKSAEQFGNLHHQNLVQGRSHTQTQALLAKQNESQRMQEEHQNAIQEHLAAQEHHQNIATSNGNKNIGSNGYVEADSIKNLKLLNMPIMPTDTNITPSSKDPVSLEYNQPNTSTQPDNQRYTFTNSPASMVAPVASELAYNQLKKYYNEINNDMNEYDDDGYQEDDDDDNYEENKDDDDGDADDTNKSDNKYNDSSSYNKNRNRMRSPNSSAKNDNSDDDNEGKDSSQEKDRSFKLRDSRFTLIKAPNSVRTIWQEYTGGIDGNPSIKELEEKYGNKWRRGRNRKTFARRKRLYKFIENGIENGKTAEEMIKILENRRFFKDEKGNLKQHTIGWLQQSLSGA